MKKNHFRLKSLFYTIILLCLLGCKDKAIKQKLPFSQNQTLQLKYAEGFIVKKYDSHKLIIIKNPWPEAEIEYRYVLVNEGYIIDWETYDFDEIIEKPINKIVVTSTTHIPSLELLGVENKLVGFPGTDYISSKKTRALIDNEKVRELGKNEGINTEVLLEIHPDVVIGFGVDGVNKTFETIKKANIPVIYNGDWVESSALAKAEWIKFFGVLFNKEKEADSIFNKIETDYFEAKALAKNAKNRPTILSGAMTKDVWHLPNGNSPEAQFLEDANVNYLWKNSNGNGSLYLSFETVLEKAKDADIWLNPSYYGSLKQLEEANSLYTNFDAFKNNAVYSFTNVKGKTGGVLYYELGTARPDLVLKDIIKVCHPELLEDYKPYFFKPLQ